MVPPNEPSCKGGHPCGRERDGTVGDGKLTGGRFQPNRGWLGRKLNLWSDYVIVGGLDGSLVAAEAVTRRSVALPLNYSSGTFKGGVHSSGAMFGGKDKMPFSAAYLTLTHSQ